MRKKKWIFLAPLAVLAIAFFIWIGGQLVLHLWNWLLPTLFGWRQITFWQAIGLLALCRILFGGWGGHGSHRPNIRRRMNERMNERWERMTPEEREKFRQSFRGRCSPFEPPNAKPTA
jgi:Ca2+/H+ antiporter, TMEM165/GDT1 family